MNYLITQDWTNTSNNHAGIKHMCNLLHDMYPNKFETIVVPDFYVSIKKNFFTRKIQFFRVKGMFKRKCKSIVEELATKVRDGDRVFFLEYMELLYPQYNLAAEVRKLNPNISIFGMVHLVPAVIESNFDDHSIHQWVNNVDKIITLGHSLTDFFIGKGIPEDKIITTFHYVDQSYYKPNSPKILDERMVVIAMGNQMRNVSLLSKIARCNSDVDFIICQGTSDLSASFKDIMNVKLIPYVPENELKDYMNKADVSLNVMIDTIGSNVIVTSMSMGLAMICSDVGSIRDYCNDENAYFCNNDDDSTFNNAITRLKLNRDILRKKQLASLSISHRFAISKISALFDSL